MQGGSLDFHRPAPARALHAPAHVQRRRLAEDETPWRTWVIGVEPQSGQAIQEPTDCDCGLGPGQLCAEAGVRALREAEVEPGVGAADVETFGVAEHGRIAVSAGDRHRDEVTALDPRAPELDVTGGIPV